MLILIQVLIHIMVITICERRDSSVPDCEPKHRSRLPGVAEMGQGVQSLAGYAARLGVQSRSVFCHCLWEKNSTRVRPGSLHCARIHTVLGEASHSTGRLKESAVITCVRKWGQPCEDHRGRCLARLRWPKLIIQSTKHRDEESGWAC